MSFADPSGLSQAPGAGGCDLVGVMCGAAGGGFGLVSVVSTHRFQWVDIFFSVVSTWFNPGWGAGSGVWDETGATNRNYFGGGGGADSGWGSYDSHPPFYFGIAFFSITFQVTSKVAVEGVPNITLRDIDARRAIPSVHIDKLFKALQVIRGILTRGNQRPPRNKPKAQQKEVEPTPMPRPTVTNERLRNTVNQLYRDGDEIPRGTAGAVRYELRTGELVRGRSHVIKARERIVNLERILREESLSPSDRTIAIRLRDDLKAALETTRGPR